MQYLFHVSSSLIPNNRLPTSNCVQVRAAPGLILPPSFCIFISAVHLRFCKSLRLSTWCVGTLHLLFQATLQRRGPGGLKHIEIRCLALQPVDTRKRLSESRWDTKNKTAELLTKHLDGLRTPACKELGILDGTKGTNGDD